MEKRKNKHKLSDPRATRHKFTTHSTRGSNKQTKLYQDSTARGNCRERRSGGGTRVASPNSALLSSLHKTDSRQFPLSAKQKKNEHKLHSNREREPTRPCPQCKRHPTTQQHSNDDDGQRQLSNTGTEKPLPKNHRQTNQGPQKKDIKARTLKERGCEFSLLTQNHPTLARKKDLSSLTHKHTHRKGTHRLSAPEKTTSNDERTPRDGCKQQNSDAEAEKSPGKNQHWTNRGSQLQRSTPKEKRVQGLLPKSN